jgi:hypothetical protein
MKDRTAARVRMPQATRALIDIESVSRIEEVTATDREHARALARARKERQRGKTRAKEHECLSDLLIFLFPRCVIVTV